MSTFSALSPAPYRPEVEKPEDGEEETIRSLCDSLQSIEKKVAEDEGHAFRGVHAKSHGLLRARLQVHTSLPEALAQGLFAQPAEYNVVMRFSTTPGDLLSDKVSTPRGVALKIIGVPGARLPGDAGDVTQDFVMVNGPVFAAPDAGKFAKNLQLLAATTDRAPRTKNVLSAALRGAENLLEKTGHSSAAFKSLGGHPATHILGETFYSQAPILYGKYMAKISLAPVSPELKAHSDEPIELAGHDDALREAVVEHFAHFGGTWELRVQLCTDLARMPIEDASVEWPQDLSPYVPVATLSAEPQTAWSAHRATLIDDRMAFNPWHTLAAHRPLGSIMRVRKAAYELSARLRAAHNRQPIGEPTRLPDFDQ